MYFTVYKITNLKNSKFYIGCHKTNNIDDDYVGSGRLIKLAIQKYGIKNFKKEILFVFKNENDMFSKEKNLIKELKPEYNLHKGGNGGWEYVNSRNLSIRFYLSKESNRRAQASLRELRKEKSFQEKINKKIINTTNFKKEKGLINPGFFKNHKLSSKMMIGKKNSEKQSGELNSNYGKKWIYNEEMQKSISVPKTEVDRYISSGWKLGRKIKW